MDNIISQPPLYRKTTKTMAKIYQDLGGAFGGHVGPVVGYMWKQRACLRAYRQHINYPNTESQQQQRSWFVGMVRFASQAKEALRLGLKQKADQASMTEGNYFIMRNKQHFGKPGSKGETVYSRLQIAEGAAANVVFGKLQFESGEVVSVDFEKNTMFSRASNDDSVYLYAYCPAQSEGMLSAPTERRNKHLSVKLPETWVGLEIHVYGFVVDRNGRPSDSTYIGIGRVNCYEERGRYIPIDGKWNDFVTLVNDEQTMPQHEESSQKATAVELPFTISKASPPE